MSQAIGVGSDSVMSDVQKEVARRLAQGGRQVSLAQFESELRAIGYTLDRDADCKFEDRYMTGELAGEHYPAVNMCVRQADDGKSAFHFQARRDANFDRLQQMRFHQEVFSVHRGRIYQI